MIPNVWNGKLGDAPPPPTIEYYNWIQWHGFSGIAIHTGSYSPTYVPPVPSRPTPPPNEDWRFTQYDNQVNQFYQGVSASLVGLSVRKQYYWRAYTSDPILRAINFSMLMAFDEWNFYCDTSIRSPTVEELKHHVEEYERAAALRVGEALTKW